MDSFLLRKNFYQSGFTLIETLVAIGVITVGLISALTLINTSLFYASNINDRLIAANLTAEGIELIRNGRDNNWIRGNNWDNGLNGSRVYETACQLNACEEIDFDFDRDRFLKLDTTTGLYNYRLGDATLFKRKINIQYISEYEIRIISSVTWQRRGISYTSSAEDHLFNWK